MGQEGFVARVSPDTRHYDPFHACVPLWADAALHLESREEVHEVECCACGWCLSTFPRPHLRVTHARNVQVRPSLQKPPPGISAPKWFQKDAFPRILGGNIAFLDDRPQTTHMPFEDRVARYSLKLLIHR